MARTMSYTVAARVHVAVHGDRDPSDAEWAEYLDDIARRLDAIDGVFTIAMGGGISAAQRAKAVEFWKSAPRTPRIAVVTPSMLVVRAAGALRWFMPSQIKAFGLRDVEAAYDYLGLRPFQRRAVDDAVAAAKAELSLELASGRTGAPRTQRQQH